MLKIIILFFILSPKILFSQEADVDFSIDFSQVKEVAPPGVIYGINDLQNATEGVWRVWNQGVEPTGGLVRVWLKRYIGKLNESHIQASKRAQKAGLDVFLTVVGIDGDSHKKNAETEGHILKPPSDVDRWAKDLARDVKQLVKRGVNVRYIEIWNEPDMPSEWDGSRQEFATFFAKCGATLRSELGSEYRIGGPGMASGWGLGMDYFEIILDECKKYQFKPDFLSWHHYGSFATDNEFLKTPSLLQEMAEKRGLGSPVPVLSEWNVSLPSPVAKGIDNNVGAAFYSALVSSLLFTPTKHALYFFLQDGSWETKEDFAQESVGAFTLRGAPKSSFAAMKLIAEVTKKPMVFVERKAALNNLTCIATRSNKKAQILVTNAPGDILRVARKYLAANGLVMGELEGKDELLKSYISDNIPFTRLKLDQDWEGPLERTKKLVRSLKRESEKNERWVLLAANQISSVSNVRIIDSEHGNPVDSRSFRNLFDPYSDGYVKHAIADTLQDLRKQGVPANELTALEKGFTQGQKKGRIAGVTSSTQVNARASFDRIFSKMLYEMPAKFAAHPAASASSVPIKEWIRKHPKGLLVKLPPHTVALIDIDLDV